MSAISSTSDITEIWEKSPQFQRAFMDEQARRSFRAFFVAAYQMTFPGQPIPQAPYVYAMLHELEQLVVGSERRLICNCPPRHGKTEFGTVMLAAWILGRDPAAKIFVASYGLFLSEKITGKIRALIEHPHYKRIFPETRIKVGHNRSGLFALTRGGEVMACSPDSAVTGMGTQYMLVDDFHKANESATERANAIDAFRNTFLSRFDNLAEGKILINHQRVNAEDISGWAMRLGWRRFSLPAIAVENQTFDLPFGKVWHRKKGELLDPARVPQWYLDEQKLAQGPRYFSANYQQDPDVSDSGLVDWEWFGQYDEAPHRRQFLQIVQSWDPALTENFESDYSVGMTWGYYDGYWYLLDLIRVQIRFHKLVDRVAAWHKRWKADVLLIEGGSMGTALYDQVSAQRLPGKLRNPTPTMGKEDRLAACSAQLATGQYLLPAHAPWLEEFRRELLAFPGTNDDQVDALTQFLDFAFGRGKGPPVERDERGRRLRPNRRERRERRYPPERHDAPDR